MPEKRFKNMTLNEVFDLDARYSANAGRSVVSKQGIERNRRSSAQVVGRFPKSKKRHAAKAAAL
jgi:hypothetical protein